MSSLIIAIKYGMIRRLLENLWKLPDVFRRTPGNGRWGLVRPYPGKALFVWTKVGSICPELTEISQNLSGRAVSDLKSMQMRVGNGRKRARFAGSMIPK
jgi:hypothetical protein